MSTKTFLFIAICTMSTLSCGEDAQEPFLHGDLLGRITLVMDEFGKPLSDRSGYAIEVEGADPMKRSISDKDGSFRVEALKSGTYNLIFTKAGFQTRKIFSFQFTGGNVPTYYDAPILSQLSSTFIEDFSVSVTDENNSNPAKYTMIKIETTFGPPPTTENQRQLLVFIHTDNSVSNFNHSLSEINVSDHTSVIRFEKIASGTKLYAIAYPVPLSCNGYYDPEVDQFINPCLGEPSNVVEFIVP